MSGEVEPTHAAARAPWGQLEAERWQGALPALSNALLHLSCLLLGWKGDPEPWEAERKSFLGFRLSLSLAMAR